MYYNDKKERLLYIDVIKIIAILGVILIHVAAHYWYRTPIDSNKWEAMNMWNAIGRFGVSAFVMCSGVLFLNKEELKYKELFKKYILRIAVAFIIWTFIYTVIKAKFNIEQILPILKKGIPSVHLWFMIMIIGIYIVIPIIRIFIKNASKKDIEYFLLIAFIIQSIIPFLIQFEVFDWIKNYHKYLYPTVVTGYVGYFVLGYYLNKYELSKKKKICLIILGIISIVSTILLNLLKAQELNKPTTAFFNNFYPNIVFYSIGVFLFIKEICNKIKFNKITIKIISRIGSLIFGVYLVHMIIRNILDTYSVNALMTNTYIAVPATTGLVFIISLLIIYIVSKVPYLRRIVL